MQRRELQSLIGALLTLAFVSGCQREAAQTAPTAATTPPAAAETPATPAVISTDIREAVYTCADGRQIQARYDNSDPERPRATLVIDGQTFEMHNVIAASGARYATEAGFKPDHGLQWWTKGDEATLSEMVMDHMSPDPTELTTCRVVPAS